MNFLLHSNTISAGRGGLSSTPKGAGALASLLSWRLLMAARAVRFCLHVGCGLALRRRDLQRGLPVRERWSLQSSAPFPCGLEM